MDVHRFPWTSQVATIRKHLWLAYINKPNLTIQERKKKINLGHASNSTFQKVITVITFYLVSRPQQPVGYS